MTVEDDILTLETSVINLDKVHSHYPQGLPTPEVPPTKGSITTFAKLRQPSDETVEILFTPTAKDYQYRVDVWQGPNKRGFVVKAKRDLGDGMIEVISKGKTEDD